MAPTEASASVQEIKPLHFIPRLFAALGISVGAVILDCVLMVLFPNTTWAKILEYLIAFIAISNVGAFVFGEHPLHKPTYKATCPCCGLSTRTGASYWSGIVKCSNCGTKVVQRNGKLSKLDK
jgi:hypothetical protein